MNPTALFLMAGIFYLASAAYFRITMPVQPLKAMSAIAIASGLGLGVINAAGITMGVALILIAVTGLSPRLGELFPLSVVRGMQLGLGALLVKTSFNLVEGDVAIAWIAGGILAVNMLLFKKVPPLIPMLVLGIVLAFRGGEPHMPGPMDWHFVLPNAAHFWQGFILLVLPQISLTFGNAIVATEATAKLLYPGKAERLTLTSIPLSMGLANIIAGIAGGAPMCHGCGGLTAHNKFGAHDHRSGYIIGAVLIAIALFCGKSSGAIVSAFPSGILGVLLFYVGIQHALFVKDILDDRKAVLVAFTVGIVGLALGNLTIGFLTGLTVHYGSAGLKKIARA
jgi:SulP family sulfate permease